MRTDAENRRTHLRLAFGKNQRFTHLYWDGLSFGAVSRGRSTLAQTWIYRAARHRATRMKFSWPDSWKCTPTFATCGAPELKVQKPVAIVTGLRRKRLPVCRRLTAPDSSASAFRYHRHPVHETHTPSPLVVNAPQCCTLHTVPDSRPSAFVFSDLYSSSFMFMLLVWSLPPVVGDLDFATRASARTLN